MFVHHSEGPVTPCEPGVLRTLLCSSGSLMMTEVSFRAGSRGNVHSHPHQQISYIVRGSLRFTVGGETREVAAGDSVYIPPDTAHGVLALEDSVMVDVFSPIREDFLPQAK